MPDDSVIKNHSRVGVEEFVVRIAEWARKTRTNCVIKPHPGCRRESHPKTWTAISRATDGNEWALLRAENIHSLISHATGVFTINSGTGFEALVHGKPVVVFGEADYDHVTGKGALDSLGACVRYLREAPDLVAAQKFAAYYVRHQCFWLGIDQRAETRLYDYFSSYTRQMRSTS